MSQRALAAVWLCACHAVPSGLEIDARPHDDASGGSDACTTCVDARPIDGPSSCVTGTCPAEMCGLGTAAAPCEVTTCEQLQAMNEALALDYRLANDVSCAATTTWNGGAGFQPIGRASPWFTGDFDGAGHVITDIHQTTNASGVLYWGLFGRTMGSTIQNVGIVNTTIALYGNDNYVGALVGLEVGGTIATSFATGSVAGNQFVGGLVGASQGAIASSYAIAAVEGNDEVGGLVGEQSGPIASSYAAGPVLAHHSTGGGLVGYKTASTLTDSFAAGSIGGGGQVLAGLVGGQAAGTIADCFWIAHPAEGCLSEDFGTTTCTAVATRSYFYDLAMPPMTAWSPTAWSTSCSPSTGLPPLAWQSAPPCVE